MTKCLEFIEIFGPNNEPAYVRVPITTIIAWMKIRYPGLSDDQAIDEFKVVHWAQEVDDERDLT